jgi:hypothetical protein
VEFSWRTGQALNSISDKSAVFYSVAVDNVDHSVCAVDFFRARS